MFSLCWIWNLSPLIPLLGSSSSWSSTGPVPYTKRHSLRKKSSIFLYVWWMGNILEVKPRLHVPLFCEKNFVSCVFILLGVYIGSFLMMKHHIYTCGKTHSNNLWSRGHMKLKTQHLYNHRNPNEYHCTKFEFLPWNLLSLEEIS